MVMKEIPGLSGYYATEDGHIYSSYKNGLRTERTINGYKYVFIRKKNHIVHRLIAMTFIPNPNNYPCINHIDEDKSNNSVTNLEWCTYKYNNHYGKGQPTQKAIKAKSKPVVQLGLDGEFIARYDSASSAERLVGGSPKSNGSNVSALCRKSRSDMNTAYGYKWMFENDYKNQVK